MLTDTTMVSFHVLPPTDLDDDESVNETVHDIEEMVTSGMFNVYTEDNVQLLVDSSSFVARGKTK